MANDLSPELTLYVEVLFTLALVAVAGLLYALLRRALAAGSPAAAKAKSGVPSLGQHLALPASLLIVLSVLRWPAVRALLPLGPKYQAFVDAAFFFFVVFFLIRLADVLLRRSYAKRNKPFPLPRVLHGFILIVIYIAALFAVLDGFLGVDIKPLLAGSAILTAVIGLALQGVLGNILAGMSLHYTKSFRRGDWVKIGETEGVVVDTNWRETRVLDRAKNIVVLPNNAVASQTITNFSLPERTAGVTLPVKAGFEAPPATVLRLLADAARETPGVAAAPPPDAFCLSYDEFGLSYLLRYFITDYHRKNHITTEVARIVWAKFRRHGIEIPVPVENKVRRVLRAFQSDDRIAEATVEKERNYRDLARSSFLRVQEGERAGEMALSESEVRDLASRADRRRFAAREVLFRQGESGENCFLVANGKVRGEIVTEEGGRRFTTEFEVGPGGIVGEMSLFTGIPRTATVVVGEDAELIEIGAEAFAALLGRNPELAEAIAEIVAARNRSNLETLRKIKELSAGAIEDSTNKKSVLEYLKRLVQVFKR
jgi:small-conductance mechanosensitive channel